MEQHKRIALEFANYILEVSTGSAGNTYFCKDLGKSLGLTDRKDWWFTAEQLWPHFVKTM